MAPEEMVSGKITDAISRLLKINTIRTGGDDTVQL
jgi:hypothetical protein